MLSAQLTDSILRGASLYRAQLRGSRLLRCDLRGADLREADLTYTEVVDCALDGIQLAGANLKHSKGWPTATVPPDEPA